MLESSALWHTPSKINHLFEAQSKIRPEQSAVIFSSQQRMTYRELNAKANQFARYLIEHETKPGDVIPIISDKSLMLLVAILGALKAGVAYSPINPDGPSKHIEAVVKETKAKCICVASNLINRFAINPNIVVVNLEDIENKINGYSTEDIFEASTELDLAYVIYTSGTTGNPKGAMISHANLLPTYYSWEQSYSLTNADIHLQMAPVGFDVFAGDWIRALCSGGTLVLCPKNILIEPEKLYDLISKEKINCAEFVPVILRQLARYIKKNHYDLKQFRLLICGSDQWTMGEYRSIKKMCRKEVQFISSYGLTETAIDSSFFEEKEPNPLLNDKEIVPIGRPFNHVSIYLFKGSILADPGEEGEICIGGEGVGLGYLNQAKLTSEKFVIKNIDGLNKRIYRTGDRGRLLQDGNFLFLGRNEEHVKIHGERIDLPSLEAVINQHPKVRFGLLVPTKEAESKEIVLKCFLTINDNSLTFAEITSYIRNELPSYYVPRHFYEIETVPLSINGKVDRSIASQKIIRELKPEFKSATDQLQEYLISLWKEILGEKEIGINNSFYDLGGSSLLYITMLNKVNKEFNLSIRCSTKFETIDQLAQDIKEKSFSVKQSKSISENLLYSDKYISAHSSWSNSSDFMIPSFDKSRRT